MSVAFSPSTPFELLLGELQEIGVLADRRAADPQQRTERHVSSGGRRLATYDESMALTTRSRSRREPS